MPYTHISSPMPDIYRTYSSIPRGVANRRAAINWIRQNGKKPGVLYFGDDDNTFDLKLFDEIRYTKRVSMFPVGLIGMYAVSTPVVKNVCIQPLKSRFIFHSTCKWIMDNDNRFNSVLIKAFHTNGHFSTVLILVNR